MAVDAKNDGAWVGRSIRRLEDPALVAGHGRFTGDLPAARWVRFVRSSVASGRIKRIVAPQGAMVVTAAELAGLKPIQPLLHKFNYVPIRQPEAAGDVVIEGRLKTPGLDAEVAAAQRAIKVDTRSHRQNALPMEPH